MKKLFSIIGLCLLLSSCLPFIESSNDYFNAGYNKADRGDHDGAIADYTRAIELKPDYAYAFNNRGASKDDKGDYDGAIADYTRAIELKPDYANAYRNRGDAKDDKGDYDGAIADYARAIELNPDYAAAFNSRGIAKKKKGDYDGAIADYTRAIELKPDYAGAYFNQGLSKDDKGDYDGAIADYTRAIELKPDYADAYHNRGTSKHTKADYDGAIADYTRAIELKSDDAQAYRNRGNTKRLKADYDGAIADFNKAIEIEPEARTYSLLSDAYVKLGRYDDAINNYQKAVSLDSDPYYASKLQGLFKVLNGNPDFMKKTQLMLAAMNLYQGMMDGAYSPATKEAIRKFQEKIGAEQTSEINNETYGRLVDDYQRLSYMAVKSPSSDKSPASNCAIKIFSPPTGYVSEYAEIQLDALVNCDEKIAKITVKLNNNELADLPPPTYGPQQLSASIDCKIPLSEGKNRITVIATTAKGRMYKESVEVTGKKNGFTKIKSELWAVVVGINDYDDEKVSDLSFAAYDAVSFAEILMDKGRFPPDHISLLVDKAAYKKNKLTVIEPTRDNIMRALESLRGKVRADDTVIIYFSGHGATVPDGLSRKDSMSTFMVPKDFEYSSPRVKGLLLEDVKRYTVLAPERMFLILDSCFSGNASDGGAASLKTVSYGFNMKSSPNDIAGGFDNPDKGKARVVLTSSLGSQVSLELPALKHGVFTYYLIDALGLGKKRVGDIYPYIHEKVLDDTKGLQEPQLETVEQRGDILIY